MRKTILFLFCVLIMHSIAFTQSYVPETGNKYVKVSPTAKMKAYAFNLRDVDLLEGSPFYHAMQKDAAYILLLEPDRLLHRFFLNAGLTPKAAVYGGWESDGLSGHTLGHYLSAASMLYVTTSNAVFKQRVDYTIAELAVCRDARKTGYIGAIPGEDSIFAKVARGEIKTGGFDLNGGWSPWYTFHKVIAGLVDAYLYADNTQALELAKGMADWTATIVNHLDSAQLQKMLRCEYGGMNDVLAAIYAITGEKKYLDLSYRFYDDFVMAPLSNRIDPMPGKHSNTNVPKAIGSAAQYELTGRSSDSTIASFFWETMVHNHSYVIGGNSNYEYCGEPGKLSDRLSDNTCETCNTYNMLKLTRHLFGWNPRSSYMDFYEKALYNHILASQNPENGMMTYFVPLRMGTKKAFSDSFNTFTCCVGSGMENHTKYGEQVYSHDGKSVLWVNLFIPSRVRWKERGLVMVQQTRFPDNGIVEFTFENKNAVKAELRIRLPYWNKGGLRIKINGKLYKALTDQDGYMRVPGNWKKGDRVEVQMNMNLYTEAMPDNSSRIAFKYGPLVLAGQLGDTIPDPVYGVPVLLTENRNVSEWVVPDGREPVSFVTRGTGQPFDVRLLPFYKTYKEYYSVYWDYFTPAKWSERKEEYEKEKKEQRDIEARTVDYFRVGEMQPERDHHLTAGERSYVSDALGVNGREARSGSYFAFDMKVDTAAAQQLLLVYIGDDKNREFDILVEEVKIATEKWEGGSTGKFYNRVFDLPSSLISGKQTIHVRIEANSNKTAGRVFGVRVVRKNVEGRRL